MKISTIHRQPEHLLKAILSTFLSIFLTLGLCAQENPRHHRLTVFFTNDIHGGIVPQKAEFLNPEFPPRLGGGAAVSGIIGKVRAENQNRDASTLLIDGGDTFQGTLVGTLSKGMAVVEYMNRMQYDAVVPGNHDFDEGKDNFIKMAKASKFPWVAANIYDSRTDKPWEWIKPWVIVDKAGLKVGLTGATTVGTRAMSFPDNIRHLEFRHEVVYLQKAVDEMRAAGVDLVVVLCHVGLPFDPREGYEDLKQMTREMIMDDQHIDAMEIAHFVKGIDILLGGHLHKGYREAWEDPVNHTICVQNYANGGNLGWMDVFIDRPTRSIAGYTYAADDNALLLLQQDQFWPESSMAEFVTAQQKIYEKNFKDVIGTSPNGITRSSIGEAPMNNLLCEVMRNRARADISFMNFGGIRADIKSGAITREDVFKVLPFGNEIVSFEASGAFIKQILERKIAGGGRGLAIAGAKVTFNKNLPDGERVVYMEIGGQPLEPAKSYRIATSDYLLEGNSGLFMLKHIPRNEVDFHGVLLRDAVIEFIGNNSPLNIPLDGRWKRDDNAKPDAKWLEKFRSVDSSE